MSAPWWLREEHADTFGATINVRLTKEQLERLNEVEAYGRGQGLRHVSRSSLIRHAITALIDTAEKEIT